MYYSFKPLYFAQMLPIVHAFPRWFPIMILLLLVLLVAVFLNRLQFSVNVTEFEISDGRYAYDRYSPLVFVGGLQRTGTTLIKSFLDTHPDIRCGDETKIIPDFLPGVKIWLEIGERRKRQLNEAGVTDDVILTAAANFVLGIIVGHGNPASILCNKDPMLTTKFQLLQAMFPRAKFILMIRDGRAMIHSLITRNEVLENFNSTSQEDAIVSWNRTMTGMLQECDAIGSEACMKVYYEQLVLHPERVANDVFNFLDVPLTRDISRHEEIACKPRLNLSTSQIIESINADALTKWVDWLEPGVKEKLPVLAPLLEKLGYDIISDIPNYGALDKPLINM